MKILWLCNIAPAAVARKITGKAAGGLWLDHVLEDLRGQDFTIRVLCPGSGESGCVDGGLSYATFREGRPEVYLPELEDQFRAELERFRPNVIHVWGTEYGHSLAMINAAESLELLDHLAVNIQGMVSVICRHYNDGVPPVHRRLCSLRDLLRQDNLLQQQKTFGRRGELEILALQKARHVVGRTHWDLASIRAINPHITYHHCDETLRHDFYQDRWDYANCEKHTIFAPGSSYPVKGFHYLLQAFARVAEIYPDARIYLPGKRFPDRGDLRSRLRTTHYQNYLGHLARRYGLEDKIHYLGGMSAEQMKQAYLRANVFVLPSTIENSPNTLGEAMLLGVPCIAADVGGVSTLLEHQQEGYVYSAGDVDALVHHIGQVFRWEDRIPGMCDKARQHARITHDPAKNQQALLKLYEQIKG